MRSKKVPAQPHFPNLGLLDEEFGAANEQVAPKLKSAPRRRRRRYRWVMLLSVILGVTSAVIWPNEAQQLWSLSQSLQRTLIAQTVSRGSAESAEPLVELETLKRDISELRDWQQQMSAELIALRKAHQQSRRPSVEAASWHSEQSALTYQQTVPARPKPRAAAIHTEAIN